MPVLSFEPRYHGDFGSHEEICRSRRRRGHPGRSISSRCEPGHWTRRRREKGGMADRALRRAYLYGAEGLLIVLRSLPVWRAISEIDQPRFLNAW